MKSFATVSPNNNPWTDTMTAGAIIGFIIFAVSYIYVVIFIFFDINRSKNDYLEKVEEDLRIINQLNVSASIR